VSGNHVINPLRQSDPRQLGDYQIIGRLGRGGMGTVYLAESNGGERAAVKVINPELADDETFRERFRREVESARRVRRFCTAPVLDARIEGEPLFIVTEFVDGPNLDDFVRGSGPMRGSSLEHLAVGVATALAAIHGAGVVHRDLKPANVLLSSVGPRVIDFGIARALDTVSGATRTGQFVGTPAFMAPELLSGNTATPAADVFAWGCVVAFAGTGRLPFDGPSMPSVLWQISHGEPSLDGLDEAVRDLVTRALDKDPAQRPSAQELLDVLTGRPHISTAESAETLGRTWAVPSGGATTPDPPPPTSAAAPRGGGGGGGGRGGGAVLRRPWVLGSAVLAVLVLLGTGFYLKFGGPGGPPGNLTTVYGDDFSDADSGWSGSTWISGTGYFESGYRIDADGSTYQFRSEDAPFKGTVPEHALIGADATVKTGPAYGQFGVFCRASGDTSSQSYYEFLVRADGKGALIRKVAGQKGSKQLVERSSVTGFKKNAPNHLQAACEGDAGKVRLRMWVNGSYVAGTTDDDGPLPNGGIGLKAVLENRGSGGDTQVLFDNFLLSAIH
jgi:predicted Ser/Thr protein kinase